MDRDISAAILKLHNMTMHVTWDEEAEVGTVQATVLRGRRMIAPSSTLDGRSDLGFDLRANGEALTLSVVQGGTKLLATRDVSVEVFNNCKVVNERFEVLPLSRPPPSSRRPISAPYPPSLPHSTSHTSCSPASPTPILLLFPSRPRRHEGVASVSDTLLPGLAGGQSRCAHDRQFEARRGGRHVGDFLVALKSSEG